jgi:hypothetical protein
VDKALLKRCSGLSGTMVAGEGEERAEEPEDEELRELVRPYKS